MRLTCSQIAAFTAAYVLVAPGDAETPIDGISWDSREITEGCLYVALPGERVDGHSFIASALEAGAGAVLASAQPDEEVLAVARTRGAAVLMVADTYEAVTDLARGWRGLLAGKVIALSGSTGKTTTKNLVRDVLSTTFATVATKANQNNELGVPRTLLEAGLDTEFVVVEMGMRGAGQLRALNTFVKPDIAMLTNVGESHIELLGSRENIARAKSEVFEALEIEGRAFMNNADPYTPQMREWSGLDQRGVPVVLYDGSGEGEGVADVWASEISLDGQGHPSFTLNWSEGSMPVRLGLRGIHNVHNATAAAAVGLVCGVAPEAVARALSEAQAESGRAQVAVNAAGVTVIDDAYNANPDSMRASLAMFDAMDIEGRRFAVLGDMGELGSFAPAGHTGIGAYVATLDIQQLICIGELAEGIAAAAEEAGFPSEDIMKTRQLDQALEYLESHLQAGDAVLVKASHSMELDKIAKGLLG